MRWSESYSVVLPSHPHAVCIRETQYQAMQAIPITILAISTLLLVGCDQSSSKNPIIASTPNTSTQPFHNEVYKSMTSGDVLTLISKDECEIVSGGTTFPCTYTKQDGRLRVVLTALGTPQVLYYQPTGDGVVDNNGQVLLSPEKYAKAIAERENRERQQREKEQARLRAEEAARREHERLEKLVVEAEKETTILSQYDLSSFSITYDGRNGLYRGKIRFDANVKISDVGIHITTFGTMEDGYKNKNEYHISFCQLRGIADLADSVTEFKVDYLAGHWYDETHFGLIRFRDKESAKEAYNVLVKAFKNWKEKYPGVVAHITDSIVGRWSTQVDDFGGPGIEAIQFETDGTFERWASTYQSGSYSFSNGSLTMRFKGNNTPKVYTVFNTCDMISLVSPNQLPISYGQKKIGY
jgi:hypothetical protein